MFWGSLFLLPRPVCCQCCSNREQHYSAVISNRLAIADQCVSLFRAGFIASENFIEQHYYALFQARSPVKMDSWSTTVSLMQWWMPLWRQWWGWWNRRMSRLSYQRRAGRPTLGQAPYASVEDARIYNNRLREHAPWCWKNSLEGWYKFSGLHKANVQWEFEKGWGRAKFWNILSEFYSGVPVILTMVIHGNWDYEIMNQHLGILWFSFFCFIRMDE